MITAQISSWCWSENSQLFQEFDTREYDMGGSISPGVTEFISNPPVREFTQSLGRDRRSGDIAKKAF
jgi:hypothetical protein